MKLFDSSIKRLLKNDIDLSRKDTQINQAVDSDNKNITNIAMQNELSLEDISDGFERESRRYIHTLEFR